MVAALVALVLLPDRDAWARFRWTGIHTLLVVVVVFATGSALLAGTLFTNDGFYSLLDRLGVLPFAGFTLAPCCSHAAAAAPVPRCTGPRRRLPGGHLLAGGTHHLTLVFPRYITNPALGIHAERARGPFLEAVANGLSLYGCAVASANRGRLDPRRSSALSPFSSCRLPCGKHLHPHPRGVARRSTWRRSSSSPWMGGCDGSSCRCCWRLDRRGRTVLDRTGSAVSGRRQGCSQEPVWDRYNTNAGAIRMIEHGRSWAFGWQVFPQASKGYLRQTDRYPMTGAGPRGPQRLPFPLCGPGRDRRVVVGDRPDHRSLARAVRTDVIPILVEAGLLALGVDWLVVAAFGP